MIPVGRWSPTAFQFHGRDIHGIVDPRNPRSIRQSRLHQSSVPEIAPVQQRNDRRRARSYLRSTDQPVFRRSVALRGPDPNILQMPPQHYKAGGPSVLQHRLSNLCRYVLPADQNPEQHPRSRRVDPTN